MERSLGRLPKDSIDLTSAAEDPEDPLSEWAREFRG
jgi:hypothetical protein